MLAEVGQPWTLILIAASAASAAGSDPSLECQGPVCELQLGDPTCTIGKSWLQQRSPMPSRLDVSQVSNAASLPPRGAAGNDGAFFCSSAFEARISNFSTARVRATPSSPSHHLFRPGTNWVSQEPPALLA